MGGPVASQQPTLAKAYILPKDGGEQLTCRFNPQQYTVSKSSTWSRSRVRGARRASRAEFIGTDPRSLQMELFLDTWESPTGKIKDDVERLFEWMNPTEASVTQQKPQPPVLTFRWGENSEFDAFLKSVSARYTLFREDGSPVRATVTVTLEELPAEPARTNPTSGGTAGRRGHRVSDGDSLPSIAYAQYGDPRYWRAIAKANGIDDPLRLRSGTELLLPSQTDADTLL